MRKHNNCSWILGETGMLPEKGEGDNNLRFGHNLCVLPGQVAGGSTLKIGQLPQQLESWAMGAMSLPREGQMIQGVVWGTCCHPVVLYQEGRILCCAVSEEGAAGKVLIGLGHVSIGKIGWYSWHRIPHPEDPSCTIRHLQLFHPVLSRTTL